MIWGKTKIEINRHKLLPLKKKEVNYFDFNERERQSIRWQSVIAVENTKVEGKIVISCFIESSQFTNAALTYFGENRR